MDGRDDYFFRVISNQVRFGCRQGDGGAVTAQIFGRSSRFAGGLEHASPTGAPIPTGAQSA
ncbi:MAG: hypothetical protein IJU39_03395 [Clostridia bacterium]|nr:hypothetical protein [Clostridia bacterium]